MLVEIVDAFDYIVVGKAIMILILNTKREWCCFYS